MNDEEHPIWRGFEARIERLEDVVHDLDEMLRGDRHRKIIGLLAEQDRMDADLRKINAVVFTDSTGKHGLAHDVDVLMGRQAGIDRRSEFRWKYWIPTLLAVLALSITILTNWVQIKQNFPKDHPGLLEQEIEKAKHPKGKRLYRVRHIQEKAPSDEDTKESPPK